MPKLEEADIDVSQSLDEILGSMTSVKRLSLRQFFNRDDELEHVKLCFYSDDWSKLLVWLLRNSPKLRELNIYVDQMDSQFQYYAPVEWKKRSSVPECLQNTLETFKFESLHRLLIVLHKEVIDIDGTEELGAKCGDKNRSVTGKWKLQFIDSLVAITCFSEMNF
ncbi:hypothetical protein Bca101_008799 [Brassica carinata]